MHPAYSSAFASNDAEALELEQPELEQPELVEVDDAFGDPPPHAADPTPRAARTANSATRRQRRRPLLGARLTV
jgi:hypothetical protein